MGCKCTTNDLSDGHELTTNINNNEHGGTTTPITNNHNTFHTSTHNNTHSSCCGSNINNPHMITPSNVSDNNNEQQHQHPQRRKIEYNSDVFNLINKIRQHPSSFATDIENAISNITTVKNKLIYTNGIVNVSLNEGEPAFKLEKEYDVNEYLESPFGKIYDTTGAWLFKHIATTVDDGTGEKVNLSDNIDVVVVATEILDEAVKITNTDFSQGLNEENVSTLVESLTKMEESKDSLSEEATEIFNEILVDLSSSLGEELPISIPEDFDFSKVNFKEAADAIEVVYDYSQSEEPELTEEQVDTIVTAFADNMVIIEALGTEQLVELDDNSKELVENKLNEVIAEETLTQEQIDLIKGLLGINK
jgi:hypothetical protein